MGTIKLNGIISFHMLFQCKRYVGTVSAGEIRDFRGAMQGRTDKGLFITTGKFSASAIEEANRPGTTPIDLIDGDTVWLSIDQMAELFQRDRSVIGKHVRNIFKEGELSKESVWAKFAYTVADRKVYDVDYYNLDVIISVG